MLQKQGFKAPEENPNNYCIVGNFQGKHIEFVPKSELITAWDREQKAEEILEHIYTEFNKISQRKNNNDLDKFGIGQHFLDSWQVIKASYFLKKCKHENTAIEARKPDKDSPELNSFRVRTEECRLVCLDCGLTQRVQLSFGAAQSPESVPSVGRDTSIPG